MVAVGQVAVRVDVLLGDDVHVLEVGGQRRGVDLPLLLVGCTLGQQQEAVTGPEHGEGLDHAGERGHVVFEERDRERVDRGLLVVRRRPLVEVQEAVAQAAQEHVGPVAVGGGVGGLDVEQHGADLVGRVRRVREPLEVVVDHPLEEVVELPERVVGVEDQHLIAVRHRGDAIGGRRAAVVRRPRRH